MFKLLYFAWAGGLLVVIGVTAIAGNLFNIPFLYNWGGTAQTSPPTGTGFILIGFAFMFWFSDRLKSIGGSEP